MRLPRSQAFFILFVCLSLGFSLVIPFFDRRWSASAGFGLINDAVTDSYEYDTTEGLYPDMLRLGTSNYYAIVDSGPGNDGWLQTIKVWNNNGTIKKSIISSFEYDTSDGLYPSICHVSGDIYAVSYKDSAKVTVVTIKIWDENGTIRQPVLDSQVLTYNGNFTNIIRVTGNLYAIAYQEWNALAPTNDGWFETRYINPTTGDIVNAANDTQEFDAADAYYPKMVMVDSDTVAIVYQGTADDGFLSTWNISSAGAITGTWASQWEFDTSNGGTPNIYHISGNVYAIAYRNSSTNGCVRTCTISTTGAITKSWIDTLEFDVTDCKYPTIFPVSDNIYGITYQNTSSDGAVVTLTIETDGTIGNSRIDTMEFSTADNQWYAPVIWVSGFYYALVYAGTDTGRGVVYDGWVATFQIYTNNRFWTSEASGWNTFGNGSVSWETIGQGWNLFGNTPAWSGPSGWNTFSNHSSQTMIDQGWNTFGNLSSYRISVQGWSTFGNMPAWTGPSGWNTFSHHSSQSMIDQGWNTFENMTVSWHSIDQGWNTFGSTSGWVTTHLGWSTFGNTPVWSGPSGWNTFSHHSSQTMIDQGWNTFENTTVSWHSLDQGWNTFGSMPAWTGPSGWNTFGNTPSWAGPSGWNTFGNLSSCVTTQLGWNTFGNIASWTSIDQGWNIFRNAQWGNLNLGWNTFRNISAWTDIEQGYNLFNNTPSWQTRMQGWNTFGSSLPWSPIDQGWNTFGNGSAWVLIDQGWNSFYNNNWTAIIDWYPKQGDVVDPIGFQFMANISDTNGTLMDLTWEYWNGTAWVNIGTQNGLVNGTYYQDPSPWLGLLYNHTYHYRVTVVGTQTMTKDVVFTTPSGAFVISDQMVSCAILLTIFGTFMPMGYAMRRRSAGMYLTMAGFTFLCLMLFLPVNISVFFMMVVFAGYIIFIGVKKTFFTKL
jgi:hypothetical protein